MFIYRSGMNSNVTRYSGHAAGDKLIVLVEFFPGLFGFNPSLFGCGTIATGAAATLRGVKMRGYTGSRYTYFLVETLHESGLLIITGTGQASPVACVADIKGLDELATGCVTV